MNTKSLFCCLFVGLVTLAFAGSAHADLIAHYTFDDGTGNNQLNPGSYNLSATGAAPDFSGGSYHSDADPANYLSVAGSGPEPHFTVSLWTYTDTIDQGTWKGIFSNNNSSSLDHSWQIDSSDGNFFFRSKDSGNLQIGSVQADTWQHLVIQKFQDSGPNASFWLDGAKLGQNLGGNPGGLQNFRIGINRNTNHSFNGLIDNVKIFDDSTINVQELFEEGPGQPVPEPGTLALIAMGLCFAGAIGSRSSTFRDLFRGSSSRRAR